MPQRSIRSGGQQVNPFNDFMRNFLPLLAQIQTQKRSDERFQEQTAIGDRRAAEREAGADRRAEEANAIHLQRLLAAQGGDTTGTIQDLSSLVSESREQDQSNQFLGASPLEQIQRFAVDPTRDRATALEAGGSAPLDNRIKGDPQSTGIFRADASTGQVTPDLQVTSPESTRAPQQVFDRQRELTLKDVEAEAKARAMGTAAGSGSGQDENEVTQALDAVRMTMPQFIKLGEDNPAAQMAMVSMNPVLAPFAQPPPPGGLSGGARSIVAMENDVMGPAPRPNPQTGEMEYDERSPEALFATEPGAMGRRLSLIAGDSFLRIIQSGETQDKMAGLQNLLSIAGAELFGGRGMSDRDLRILFEGFLPQASDRNSVPVLGKFRRMRFLLDAITAGDAETARGILGSLGEFETVPVEGGLLFDQNAPGGDPSLEGLSDEELMARYAQGRQ